MVSMSPCKIYAYRVDLDDMKGSKTPLPGHQEVTAGSSELSLCFLNRTLISDIHGGSHSPHLSFPREKEHICPHYTSMNGATGAVSLCQMVKSETSKVRKKIRTMKGRLLPSPGKATSAPLPVITLMSFRTLETAPGQ